MTTHATITGNRVLIAPEAIRGPIRRFDDPARKQARAEWIAALPATVTKRQAAAALGIAETPAGKLLRQYRAVDRGINRAGYMSRGVNMGQLGHAIIKQLTWEQQDDLERRSAKTGKPIAEIILADWLAFQAGGRK